MANLKEVIQHNSVQLIESFRNNLVRYSNTLWQYEIVTDAVKNKVLDVNSADEDLRANILVKNVYKKFDALAKDMPKQKKCMKTLVRMLEGGEETELVDKIKIELRESFGFKIKPANPSSEITYDETEEYGYQPSSSIPETPHRNSETMVTLSSQTLPRHSGAQQMQMVYPQHSYASHDAISEPIVGSSYHQKKYFSKNSPAGQHRPINRHGQQTEALHSDVKAEDTTLATQQHGQQTEVIHSDSDSLIQQMSAIKELLTQQHEQALHSDVKAKDTLAQQLSGIETLITQQHKQQTQALHSDIKAKCTLTEQIAGIETLITQQHEQQTEADVKTNDTLGQQITGVETLIKQQHEQQTEADIKAKDTMTEQIAGVETLITQQHEQQTEADIKTKDTLGQQIAGVKTLITQQHEQQTEADIKAKDTLAQQISAVETHITQRHQQQTEADIKTKDTLAQQISDIKELLTQQHEKAIERLQIRLMEETEAHKETRSEYQRLLNQMKDEKKVSKKSLSLCIGYCNCFAFFVLVVFLAGISICLEMPSHKCI